MTNTLLDAATHFTQTYADRTGVIETTIPGLSLVRETVPSPLEHAINRPLVALVLQGSKRVSSGRSTFEFSAGESLMIAADAPTASQITRASRIAPYISIVLELDAAIITELVAEMGVSPFATEAPVRVDPTETEVADAAVRLLRLVERPTGIPVLQAQLLRELHYWLLSGRHGSAIRSLGVPDSHARRIARAVNLIRADFARPLCIEELAATAAMGVSSFHAHFRAVTSLTPLQFQKQLRLIDARRLMLSAGESIANAAYAVGYESLPQFTREYGRLFGMSPARDKRAAQAMSGSAA